MSQLNNNTESLTQALAAVNSLPDRQPKILQSIVVGEGDELKNFRYDGRLRSFILLVNVPAAEATVAGGIEFYKADAGGIVGYNYLGQIIHTSDVKYMCMTSECCGMSYIDAVLNNAANNASNAVTLKALNRTAHATDVEIPYTRVTLYVNSPFPVGTTIELRGVLTDG